MKKFGFALTVLVAVLLCVMTIGMFEGDRIRNKKKQQETHKILERENAQLDFALSHHEILFGKYADSISDGMLRDFYPHATDVDSLRDCLKDKYERYLRTINDGLCY